MATRAILSATALVYSLSAPAWAYCYEPTTPEPPWNKPDVPFCLSSYSFRREHNCSTWELDTYLNDLDRYRRDLIAYVDESVEFARQAEEHALCLHDEAKDESGIFD